MEAFLNSEGFFIVAATVGVCAIVIAVFWVLGKWRGEYKKDHKEKRNNVDMMKANGDEI